MMNFESQFKECVEKSKTDSGYAIAAALYAVADAQYQTSNALKGISLDSRDTNAIENAASTLSKAIESISKEISNR